MANAQKIIQEANSNHYAIGAFNVANLESLKAVTSAAQAMKAPIILEASDGETNYIGYEQLSALKNIYEKETGVPIILNLDHGKDFESCKKAIEAGFDYVHLDGSKMEYEEAVLQTKETVKLAHSKGIFVEGEMDHIEGSSADHTDISPDTWAKKELFTNPDKAYDFVTRTGIDVFASFIGNLHGLYSEPKKLNLDILKDIKTKLPNTMLSLHGGSGIIEEDVKSAIKLGIVKVNVNSELRIAFKMTLQDVLNESNEIAVYKIMQKPIEAIQKVVTYKIGIFGSAGKAF
jgi:fructose-bisphosphate aldolase, class II